jgi:mono/diheme cytochrome c family protein
MHSTMGVKRLRKVLKWGGLGLLGAFIVIQLVPYGRAHDNPPVVAEPRWDSPQTRELAKAACFDCHSNETSWPWYSHVAPIAWMVQNHVDEGREELNFSRWDLEQEEAHEAAEEVLEGDMPPWSYTLTHPSARLSDEERRTLAAGLERTIGTSHDEHDEHDDD